MGESQTHKRKALNEHKKGPFLTAYAHHGNVSGAAEAVGISRDSVYDWINNDPAFAKAFKETKHVTADKLKGVMMKAGMSGDIPACKMLLQWLEPDEFTDRHKVEFESKQIPAIVAAFVNVIRRHVAPDRMPHIIADLQTLVGNQTSASSGHPVAFS